MLSAIQGAFGAIVQYMILLMETIGASVLVAMAVKSVILLARGKASVEMKLAEGICLGPELKLGARHCVP